MLNDENLYLFKFAFRSILRNRGRSFFIGFSVSLAVFIAVWVLAFFDGVNGQIQTAVVNTNTGFYQLQEKSYARTTDASNPLPFDASIKTKLREKKIERFSPELVVDANISAPEGSAALVLLGIVPSLHRNFLGVASGIFEGSFVDESDSEGIVIGKELAAIFKYKPGDQMVVNYQDIKGELRSEILTIRGVYTFSSNSFEKRFAYTGQKTLQRLYLNREMTSILYNRIPFMARDLTHQDEFKSSFQSKTEVLKTWKDLNPEMSVVIEFNDGMIKFFFIIIGLTIMMTILTPIQMLWQERFAELRMMNILGVVKRRFWKIGFFEVIQMILFSGIASSILLAVILSIQSKTGVDFRHQQQGLNIERAGIKLTGVVYPIFSANQILVTFGFIIFVMCFSYMWAIHRTLKKLGESE
jgi:putative ABC transport system permease protein